MLATEKEQEEKETLNWKQSGVDNSKYKDVFETARKKSEYSQIRIFETAHNEAQPELLFDFVNIHVNLTIDIRTVKSRERLSALRDEVRRIIHENRKGVIGKFDRVIFKTRTDLSDRSKRLFRYTMQAEVVIFANPLPIVS